MACRLVQAQGPCCMPPMLAAYYPGAQLKKLVMNLQVQSKASCHENVGTRYYQTIQQIVRMSHPQHIQRDGHCIQTMLICTVRLTRALAAMAGMTPVVSSKGSSEPGISLWPIWLESDTLFCILSTTRHMLYAADNSSRADLIVSTI